MKQRKSNKLIIPITILLAVLLAGGIYISLNYGGVISISGCDGDNCVARVIDGDTFVLEDNSTIRLICVDAPEEGDLGYEEARDFLASLIKDMNVRLEKDNSDKDAYGRLLRYAYVNNSWGNEVFVNRALVSAEYADVWRFAPDTKRCDEIAGLD
ncbi:MAG: thermonuclease family protein [archaeon]|nr:thermonuclease family protein [archaeon]